MVSKETEQDGTITDGDEKKMHVWCYNNTFLCNELRDRLGIDDIIIVLQRCRLRCYGHVLHKDQNDSVKNA